MNDKSNLISYQTLSNIMIFQMGEGELNFYWFKPSDCIVLKENARYKAHVL
jgi:hypothetical protein